MNPIFFSIGDEFMQMIFERTKPHLTETVKAEFTKRWEDIKNYASKIFTFVKLQIDLIVKKNPETDQKLWLEFVLEHSLKIDAEFLILSKKMFLYFIDQSIKIQADKEQIIQKWDQIVETIAKLAAKHEAIQREESENKSATESGSKPEKEKKPESKPKTKPKTNQN
ncbi:MAG: hypothetical protein JW737_01910 [Acidobacteria bacterium]|nr:hypothetical protein [Acidobacteriota bacterium]